MKKDIESLMLANDCDALWITGPAQHNPSMVYLTGGAHVTNADLFKIFNKETFLCHNPMERDEAAKSGFSLISYANFDLRSLLTESKGDHLLATVLRYEKILSKIGFIKGRIFLYGVRDLAGIFSVLKLLAERNPTIELISDFNDAVLLEARATKENDEIGRIRRMGKITTSVVGNTADFLSSHKVKDEMLIKLDGYPLTIGDVKRKINLWLAEFGAENPEDTIFSIGRDAGVPHSNGNPNDILRLGQTIVFDIFPCEAGGGYFYDFTRTWCIGYAPEKVFRLYEQVKEVYNKITSEIRTGINANFYQERTCELFEKMGHQTIRQNNLITSGYVHSLGHGVGLNVHEKPWFGKPEDDTNIIQPGSIFTIEPGLYYPEEGMGVRLEDTYAADMEGKITRLAEFPLDLVLPIKGS